MFSNFLERDKIRDETDSILILVMVAETKTEEVLESFSVSMDLRIAIRH